MGKHDRTQHEHLYQRFGGRRHEHGYLLCFYCGMPADTFDHHPPLSRVDDFLALSMLHERFIKVPCCSECNNLLGSSLTYGLIGREALLKSMLRKKYKKSITHAQWSEEELDGLGKNLRSKVIVALAKMSEIDMRLEYSDGLNDYLEYLDL